MLDYIDVDVERDLFDFNFISNNDNDDELKKLQYTTQLIQWESRSLDI